MKNIAVIPARSGSKGLRDKNIKLLNGKPLMAYSIEAALSSGVFDTVHVSTDSEEYAEIAREWGADVPFLRSKAMSSDTASSWDAVLEALDQYERRGKTFDTVALLQPTSPLRVSEDIVQAYQLMRRKNTLAVVSVCETDHSPLWCNTLPENGCMEGFIQPEALGRRQDLQPYYRLNGAVFLLYVKQLQEKGTLVYDRDCYAYIMPQERSVDIDGLQDFLIAEVLMEKIFS